MKKKILHNKVKQVLTAIWEHHSYTTIKVTQLSGWTVRIDFGVKILGMAFLESLVKCFENSMTTGYRVEVIEDRIVIEVYN